MGEIIKSGKALKLDGSPPVAVMSLLKIAVVVAAKPCGKADNMKDKRSRTDSKE